MAKPFHKRGCVVFVIALSALILLISGVVPYRTSSTELSRRRQHSIIAVSYRRVYDAIFVIHG